MYRLGEIGWIDRQVVLTYLTLKSRSTVRIHQRYCKNSPNVPFWHWCDVLLRQYFTNKQSPRSWWHMWPWKEGHSSTKITALWNHLRYWQNAANVTFWHWWDVSFRQLCGNKQSQGKGHRAKVKGQRAKIIVQGTRTGHVKYAVMVWCQSDI